ncbi:MAG: AMP-binding protein [Succinivibrio sp.]
MSRSDFLTDRKEHRLQLCPLCRLRQDLEDELLNFQKLWLNNDPYLEVSTSGSTGTPKIIKVPKEGMINSAVMTCSYLNLPRGSTALLCMPLKFIGAKMVAVRAMVASLELVAVTPSSHPLQDLQFSPYFAAMTPAQVINCFDNEHDRKILAGIRKLIIGGGAVNSTLLDLISSLKNEIYSTYGMTETLSHIALRRLSPCAQSEYHLFDGVSISLSDRDTLVISAPSLGVNNLETNDIVKISSDRSFTVLGRADNTINSGGIKIQAETVESMLAKRFDFDFAITCIPDEILGQKVVMLCTKDDPDRIMAECKEILPRYWAPKHVFHTDAIPRTQSGKIARAELKKLALTKKDTL